MRLALAQLNFTVGAFERNFSRMAEAVRRAQAEQADLIVFSELAATGYPPRDLLTHASFVDHNLALVDRVAALSTDQLGIVVGYAERNATAGGRPLYNKPWRCHGGRFVRPALQDAAADVRRVRREPLLRAGPGGEKPVRIGERDGGPDDLRRPLERREV